MDDKGILNIYENKIYFKGLKNKLILKNIIMIYSTKQTPSYGTHMISAFICVLLNWYTFIFLYYSLGYFLVFIIIIISLYPVSLFLTGSDWIGIEYKDHGIIKKAYFSEGTLPKGSALLDKNSRSKSSSLFINLKSIQTIKE